MVEKIALASDHAGFDLKERLKPILTDKGYEVFDHGTLEADHSVDYPDFAYKLAAALRAGEAHKGILICGSGIGISIAANRFKDIRAALVHDVTTARLARQHNDANVLVLGARILGAEVAIQALDAFLTTPFGEGRHCGRVEKLSKFGA